MADCPSCGGDNVEDARFCAHCGTGLSDRCPHCSAKLPSGDFAFCPSCGGSLKTTPTEERRFITVLFADLVGFTARSDEADPEDVRARLIPYHRRVREEIERFGGTIEKLIGDGVMAVFGVPTAHEDDPERAVRVALRIQAAAEELNDEHEGLGLSVRIGINSGEAMVTTGGHGERIVGDVVNTASRLESIAPPGGVVVGEATHRATELLIEYEEMEPAEVKGKAKPLAIWRAIEPRGRYGIDAAVRANTPFLGRESEMKVLTDTFRRVIGDGILQLVTVAAAPGMGKSRLVNEFWQWADDQPEIVWWRQGRCLPYGEGITFWALGEIVKGQAGIKESDDAETAREKLMIALEAICDNPGDRDWLTAQLSPLVGAGSQSETGDRSEAFAAWRRFLEDLAASQPLVMVIEDLHWVDDAFMEFLDDLLVWSADSPIMIICTARPELYESHPGWGGGHRNSTTISLSPLGDDQIARLISALLEQAVLPAVTQSALLQRAEGIPLYAEEFVRMLTDRGMLRGRGELEDEAEIPVPETVQGLIGARLDVLSEPESRAIEDASVVGKVFWEGAVAALGDHEDLRRSLRQLVAREWIRPVRSSSVAGETEYAFWHALTRDVAYGRIPRQARSRKHQSIAAWIESTTGERAADHAELLAHHYQSALDLAAAGGQVDVSSLETRTALALVMAGDRALRLDAVRAVSYYEKALALMSREDPDRPQVLIKAGLSRADVGDPDQPAIPMWEEAAELARASGDALAAGRALRLIHLAHWWSFGSGIGTKDLDEAIELLEAEPPSPELAEAYTTRAGYHMVAGELEEQLLWSERAVELDEAFVTGTGKPYSIRGIARYHLGDIEGGMEDLRLALEIAESEHVPNLVVSTSYVNLAGHTWLDQGPEAALDVYWAGIDKLEPRGTDMSWARAETMWPDFDLGEWDRLLVTAGKLLEKWDGQDVQFVPWSQASRAKVLTWRGDVEGALELFERCMPRLHEIEDLQMLTPALAAAARARLMNGDESEALALIDELFDRTEGKSPLYRAIEVTDMVRLLTSHADLERARAWCAGSAAPSRRCEIGLQHAEVILAEAEGDIESAVTGYLEVADSWSGYGHALEHSLARYGAGRCLLALGRTDEAGPQISSARDMLVGLGATPFVEEIDGVSDQAAAL